MTRACHQKFKETGLWFEIKCLENDIKSKESRGEDTSFEKKLLRSYKKYTEEDVESSIK